MSLFFFFKPIFVQEVQIVTNTNVIVVDFEELDILGPSGMHVIRAPTGIPGTLYGPNLPYKLVAVRIVEREATLLYSHALSHVKPEFTRKPPPRFNKPLGF
jgi:hypothetical protein